MSRFPWDPDDTDAAPTADGSSRLAVASPSPAGESFMDRARALPRPTPGRTLLGVSGARIGDAARPVAPPAQRMPTRRLGLRIHNAGPSGTAKTEPDGGEAAS